MVLKEIQYLRAAAVIMVLCRHVYFIHDVLGYSPYFDLMAASGVDIFFIISGYVVSGVLMRSLVLDERAGFITNLENNIPRLKAFFVRRIFRLFPVAFLLVAVDIVCRKMGLYIAGGINITEEMMALFSHITMQSDMDTMAFAQHTKIFRNLNHYWSLAVEERFYLFFPLVLIFCGSVRKFMGWAVAIIIGLSLLKGLYHFGEYPYGNDVAYELYNNGFLRMDSFMFGILVYQLQHYTHVFQKIFTRRYNIVYMNLLTLLLLILIAREPVSQIALGQMWQFRGTAYCYLVEYVLSAILITLAALNEGYVLNIPGLRHILLWIGNRSYSIYIFQFLYVGITIIIAQHIGMSLEHKLRLTGIYIAVTVVASEAIYHVWEKPLRNKGRKIAADILSAEKNIAASSPGIG